MRAKKFLMAFTAIAAISAVSCTEDEELFDNSSNVQKPEEGAVMFGTYLSTAPESRASVMDLPALKEKGFGVFGYYTESNEYNTEDPKHTPNFMYNQEVTWKGDDTNGGMWQYSPVKYWPSNPAEKISFFAYAPYINPSNYGATGITGFSGNNVAGDPKLSFKMDADVDKQIDLLYSSSAMNIGKQSIGEKVKLNFKHALSRISFKRVAFVDENDSIVNGMGDEIKNKLALTDKSTVIINSLSISSERFGISGDLNLRTGEWDNYKTGYLSFNLSREKNDFDNYELTPETASKVMKLTKDNRYMMVMPTPWTKKDFNDGNGLHSVLDSIPLVVTLNFDVITEDPNLDGGKVKITSEVTTDFKFAFEAGKSYNFVARIGLTSVKLDAVVTDWIDGDSETGGRENDININTPNNDSYTLILDALNGKFKNGSEFYIINKFGISEHTGDVIDAVFEIPEFYNNKYDWKDPANEIYNERQNVEWGFICWCDKKLELVYEPGHLMMDEQFKDCKYYSPTVLTFYQDTEEPLTVPSSKTITIPKNDPKKFRILYAIWPVGWKG